MSFPSSWVIKNLPASAGDTGSGPGTIPWRRKWQPTPVFLPGKSRGQRGLEGYSPWGHKELDTIEQLNWTELKQQKRPPRWHSGKEFCNARDETQVQSLGWEDPLEKEMVTHSSILAWRIPWTEGPGGLQSMGLQSQTWHTNPFTRNAVKMSWNLREKTASAITWDLNLSCFFTSKNITTSVYL